MQPGEEIIAMLCHGNDIRTFTGTYIDPLNPSPAQICIEDIAHALSFIPRFGGHTQVFYSVAQHSLYVSDLIRRHHPDDFLLQLQGLMHDAAEAYLMDLPSPIKHHMPLYIHNEQKVMRAICRRFSMEFPFSEEVKRFDQQALEFEFANLMRKGSGIVMVPARMKSIEQSFIARFDALVNILY